MELIKNASSGYVTVYDKDSLPAGHHFIGKDIVTWRDGESFSEVRVLRIRKHIAMVVKETE